MTRFETTTCYHCNAEGTGREHVPPRCLFPRGGDWSRLMTVPSCATHNNGNSRADDYLKFLLGAIAKNVPAEITGSAARSAVRLAQRRSRNLRRHSLRWEGDVLVITNDFPLDFPLLRACLEKIARALYFHHHQGQRKLLGDVYACPLFIPIDPEKAPELAEHVRVVRAAAAVDFEQRPKLGPHQEIFAYQVNETDKTVTINMEFYGRHRAMAMASMA